METLPFDHEPAPLTKPNETIKTPSPMPKFDKDTPEKAWLVNDGRRYCLFDMLITNFVLYIIVFVEHV